MGTPSYTQVAANGSGNKIHNLQITTLVPDATTGLLTPTTVQMQVIAIADSTGAPIDFSAQQQQLGLVLAELKLLRQAFQDWSGTNPRYDPTVLVQ